MKSSQKIFWVGVAVLTFLAGASSAGETWNGTIGKAASRVLGQEDFTSGDANRGGTPSQKTMSAPGGVAIDPVSGKLFVCDGANHRVLRFASAASLADGVLAEAVLGQADFDTTTPATSRSKMRLPSAIAVDNAGRLWVADSLNHRVLRFDSASAKANGADADGVLGQINFNNGASALSQTRMKLPLGLAVDGAGRLWVADHLNHRILRFDDAANKGNGGPADAQIGQVDFLSDDPSGRTGLSGPAGLAVDSDGGIWIADSGINRVLRYDNAATRSGLIAADFMLGQTDIIDFEPGLSANEFDRPTGLLIDSRGTLWVSDFNNHRILRFDKAAQKVLGAGADGVLGQEDFASNSDSTKRSKFRSPFGMAIDRRGDLWVADQGNNRVIRFQPDRFQPDGLIGKSAGGLIGNGQYSAAGTGQTIPVKMKGRRKGRAFFSIENDGNVRDNYFLRATRGNRKLKVTYLAAGRNVTAQLMAGTQGSSAAGANEDFEAVIKSTKKSRRKGARLSLSVDARSLTDGESDTVIAKVKKKRK